MKRTFTFLMTALFLCVGMVKAAVTDVPEMSTEGNIKWYTIKNTRSASGPYLYWTKDGVKDANSITFASLFYFTGTVENCKIHNAATPLLFTGAGAWNESGVSCKISETPHSSKAGVAIEFSNTSLNEQNTGDGYTTWGADDEGSIYVIEAVTDYSTIVANAKTAAITEFDNLCRISAVYPDAAEAKAVVEAAGESFEGLKSINTAVLDYKKLADGKNVKFKNHGSGQRDGRHLGYDKTNSRAAAVPSTGDDVIWTIKACSDGTFKLYNFVNDLYLGAPNAAATHATEGDAPSFKLIPTETDKAALVCINGEMVHVSNGDATTKLMSYYDLADGASLWTISAVPAIVVDHETLNAANAAKTALPYAIQQAYGLVTDAANYFSNYKSAQEGSYEALLDNAEGSFFHSAYGTEAGDGSGVHYIQADLGEGKSVDEFYFYMVPRSSNGNNRPKDITVSGSNDLDGDFTEIAKITTTLDASMTPYMSEKLGTSGANYRYIRLTVTSTNTSSVFFTLSELYFFPADGDAGSLAAAYNNFNALSITDAAKNDAANALINGEATLALSNIKKEIATLLAANEENHAEVPALGQYATEAYDALNAAYADGAATQESLETAIAAFKATLNMPVYFITSAWDGGYPAGSAIYFDGAWKWKTANIYDKQMWMTIPGYTNEDVPVVDAYAADGTSYAICDYLTGTKMRGKDVQIVKIAEWEGAYSLQYNADATSKDAAHHAQSGGALVNWKPAAANDCQASAWRVEYIGNSYDLDQLTDEYFAAAADLVAVNVPNFNFAAGVNNYNEASKPALDAAVANRTAVLNKLSTAEDIAAAKTQLEAAIAGVQLNMPVQGKYYRIRCTGDGMKRLQSTIGGDDNRLEMKAGDEWMGAASIFCYTEGGLKSYTEDKFINAYRFEEGETVPQVIFSAAANGAVGCYNVKVKIGESERYIYGKKDQIDSGTGNPSDQGYNWWLEEVTELPVLNVALDMATAELTAADATITLVATVTPEVATNKAVTWTSSDEAVATVVDGVVTAVGNGTATITATAGGFSASCEVKVSIAVTGINTINVASELVIYDLSGRRVEKMEKGIYIVNGVKVVKK